MSLPFRRTLARMDSRSYPVTAHPDSVRPAPQMGRVSALPRTASRWCSGRLTYLALVLGLALSACASAPPHYPSQTAQTYVGKPLFDLEMRWSTPSSTHSIKGGHVAKWEFDQYNFAGCHVIVHTDTADIIRGISWTRGCGPQKKKKKQKKPAG